MKLLCPNCGNKSFLGVQNVSIEVVITEEGTHDITGGYLDDSIIDRFEVKGPYKCLECSHEYDELPIIREK